MGWIKSYNEDRDNGSGLSDEAIYSCDQKGKVTSLVDPAGYRTQWEYNVFGSSCIPDERRSSCFCDYFTQYDLLSRIHETRNGSTSIRTVFNKHREVSEENTTGMILETSGLNLLSGSLTNWEE